MPDDALWRLDATALVAGYRAGHFTPEQALQACLARDAANRDHLNALIWRDPEGALAAARASTRRWARGQPLSELDGVPVTVKDNLHVQGWPTRWGSRLLPELPRPADELPVARLRAAGAVLWAKTHLPEFAMQGITDNLLHGPCHNPWDLGRTPGGSSGGAAAAVAAGVGPLALATDGGGSIRRPAAHCGVLGVKPPAGRVPGAGGLPGIFLDSEVVGGWRAAAVTCRPCWGCWLAHPRLLRLSRPPDRPASWFCAVSVSTLCRPGCASAWPRWPRACRRWAMSWCSPPRSTWPTT